MRIFLVILAALIVAGGTGFYVLQGLQPAQPAQVAQVEAPQLREVFTPAHEIAVGTIITPERVTRMQMTESAISGQMIVADEAGQAFLAGSVARQVLPQGVPIARSAVVQPGDRGFLAAVLPKGKRAITIPISEVAGIGGLVIPGDRVDLILTYSIAGDLIDAERDIKASETVLKNIRVLALDQRLGPVIPKEKEAAKAETPPIARTATIEVTPQQAEMVTLGQTLGDLSLALNSVRDGGDPETDSPGPIDLAGDGVVPAAARLGLAASSLLPRRMTIDSDVTSLLQRQLAAGDRDKKQAVKGESPVPLPDRTTKVQVVRGVQSHAIQLGTEAAAAAAPAAAAPAAEASASAPTTE
jgi:pilus assembly protein CpaB